MAVDAGRRPDRIVESLAQDAPRPFTWVYVERPADAELPELAGLRTELGLSARHLAECVSRRLLPKMIEEPQYRYLVLGLPSSSRSGAKPAPIIAAFLGADFLVTIHHGDARPLARLFRECQDDPAARRSAMSGGPRALLSLICERVVGQVGQAVDVLAHEAADLEVALGAGAETEWIGRLATLSRESGRLRRLLDADRAALLALAAGDEPAASMEWRSLADGLSHAETALGEVDDGLAALRLSHDSQCARRAERASRLTAVCAALSLPPVSLSLLLAVGGTPLLSSAPYYHEALISLVVAFVVVGLYGFRRAGWI